jgi:hypothetical protein
MKIEKILIEEIKKVIIEQTIDDKIIFGFILFDEEDVSNVSIILATQSDIDKLKTKYKSYINRLYYGRSCIPWDAKFNPDNYKHNCKILISEKSVQKQLFEFNIFKDNYLGLTNVVFQNVVRKIMYSINKLNLNISNDFTLLGTNGNVGIISFQLKNNSK